MHEQQYYTPKIEDLFVGYEYQWYAAEAQHIPGKPNDEYWNKSFVSLTTNLRDFEERLAREWVRTPYLTREQIEAEGWVLKKAEHMGKQLWFIKTIKRDDVPRYKTYKMSFVPNGAYNVTIWNDTTEAHVLHVECPSINELRKICKMVGMGNQ